MTPPAPCGQSFDLAVECATSLLIDELVASRALFQPFRSVMEAEAICRKMMDQLTEAVRTEQTAGRPRAASAHMRLHAIQLGAMAILFLLDCPDRDGLPHVSAVDPDAE